MLAHVVLLFLAKFAKPDTSALHHHPAIRIFIQLASLAQHDHIPLLRACSASGCNLKVVVVKAVILPINADFRGEI